MRNFGRASSLAPRPFVAACGIIVYILVPGSVFVFICMLVHHFTRVHATTGSHAGHLWTRGWCDGLLSLALALARAK